MIDSEFQFIIATSLNPTLAANDHPRKRPENQVLLFLGVFSATLKVYFGSKLQRKPLAARLQLGSVGHNFTLQRERERERSAGGGGGGGG